MTNAGEKMETHDKDVRGSARCGAVRCVLDWDSWKEVGLIRAPSVPRKSHS